jgi:hypothetical protein
MESFHRFSGLPKLLSLLIDILGFFIPQELIP